MRRRTPQEKKQLSLDRDRRNVYGENDKASRKNIPRAKARARRANRRAASTALSRTVGRPDEQIDDAIDDAVTGRRDKSWRKRPDMPLGLYLSQRKNRIRPALNTPTHTALDTSQ